MQAEEYEPGFALLHEDTGLLASLVEEAYLLSGIFRYLSKAKWLQVHGFISESSSLFPGSSWFVFVPVIAHCFYYHTFCILIKTLLRKKQ